MISRWLSEARATPPGQHPQPIRIPEGWQRTTPSQTHRTTAVTPGGVGPSLSPVTRGVAALNPWLIAGIPAGWPRCGEPTQLVFSLRPGYRERGPPALTHREPSTSLAA